MTDRHRVKRTTELFHSVRQVLLSDWDPLEVGENPALIDEYDSYVPAILEALQGDSPREHLISELQRIEQSLGCTVSPRERETAAEKLLRFFESRPKGLPGNLPSLPGQPTK